MKSCLDEVAKEVGGETKPFAGLKDAEISACLESLGQSLRDQGGGFELAEVHGGYRMHSDHRCGHWLKHLLNHKPSRLSRPGLETLAIVAYRQPLTRGEIERIRGVAVDHVVRLLMEMQLVRIVGRSELPGRPFLYGTTQAFLDHFGLKSLDDLSEVDILRPRPEIKTGHVRTTDGELPLEAVVEDNAEDAFEDEDENEDDNDETS
jgi:segregation and condensation protein B